MVYQQDIVCETHANHKRKIYSEYIKKWEKNLNIKENHQTIRGEWKRRFGNYMRASKQFKVAISAPLPIIILNVNQPMMDLIWLEHYFIKKKKTEKKNCSLLDVSNVNSIRGFFHKRPLIFFFWHFFLMIDICQKFLPSHWFH